MLARNVQLMHPPPSQTSSYIFPPEEDLIVNVGALNRDKLQLAIGDIVELTPCVENGHAPL